MHPYLSGSPHRIRYVREAFERMLENPVLYVGMENKFLTGLVRKVKSPLLFRVFVKCNDIYIPIIV